MAPIRRFDVDPALLLILIFPLLGVFFPWETYLSQPTLANAAGVALPLTATTSIVLTATAAYIVWLYMRSAPVTIPALARNWLLLVFVGWMFVTTVWAEAPGLAVNRTGRSLICCLFAIYVGSVLSQRALLRLLFFALLVGMAASILVTVVAPGYSRVTDARGAWRGAFAHKNSTGTVAALALLLAYSVYASRAASAWLVILLGLSASAMLVLSNSMTALLGGGFACLIGMGVAALIGQTANTRFVVLSLGAAAVALLALAIGSGAFELEVAGRDSSLTGRTDVWRFAHIMIDRQPVWGYGHSAWTGPQFVEAVRAVVGWPAPHAHNTWLDLRLQLGVPGLAIGVVIWAVLAWRIVRLALFSRDPECAFWIAIMVFLTLRSMTETILVDPAVGEMTWLALAYVRTGALLRRGAPTVEPQLSEAAAEST